MRHAAWTLVIVVTALWQVEMAVEAGLATLPRNRRPKPQAKAAIVQPATPICTGTSCRLPQLQQPSVTTHPRVIVR